MTTTYHVDLTVAGHAWSIDRGDVPTMDDLTTGLVLDGLSLQWSYGSPGLFPDQPQPVTLALQLLFSASFLADDVVIGAAVALTFLTDAYPDAGDPSTYATATFSGRIGTVSAAPHRLGVLYTVVCTDITAQLGESFVGDTPWPAEPMLTRINRIAALAGLPALWVDSDTHGGSPLAARDVDAQPALELLTTYLRQWAYDSPLDNDPHRLILTGHINPPDDVYQLVELPEHITLGRYPGRLHADGTISFVREGVPGVGIAPWVLDAAWLDFAAVWTQTKGRAPNAVVVTGPGGAAVASTGEEPLVASRLDTELTDVDDAALVAQMYLPDTTQQAAWTVDSFRLYGDLDDVNLGSGQLMLSGAGDGVVTGPQRVAETLTGVVVVDNIPATQTPVFQFQDSRAFYAGRLTGATLTIQGGRWFVDFTLRPDIPRPPRAGDGAAVTWAAVAADVPALTWAEVDSVYTWADVRLIGRTT